VRLKADGYSQLNIPHWNQKQKEIRKRTKEKQKNDIGSSENMYTCDKTW